MGPGQVVPPPPPGFVLDQQAAPPPPPPGFVLDTPPAAQEQGARPIAASLQGLARGAADLAGAPVDIGTLAVNAGLGLGEVGANLFLSDENEITLPQITNPVGGSDWIADLFSSGYEGMGGDVLDYDEMGGGEQLAYNVNRFGGQAAAGAAALAKAAGTRAGATLPKWYDRFLAPYVGGDALRTVAADTAGGAGAGAALTVAEDLAPDSTLTQIVAMLGGGMAGSAGGALAARPDRALANLTGFLTDPSIPVVPGTLEGTARRTADMGARVLQGQASDPAAAAARVGERSGLAALYGDPMPTTGIASDDIGLIGLERGMRMAESRDNPTLRRDFLDRDQAIKTGAADAIEGLRDPAADQAAGLDFARNLPDQLAQERDAAALPILDRVQQSSAQVDVDPVLQAIEGTMAEAKRPAVRSALEQARSMLNLPGGDEIDTSVAGLYETRKAISDIIDGRTDNPTGRYAKKELIAVRDELDKQIAAAEPEFLDYLDSYRQGSAPLNEMRDSEVVSRLVNDETDLRNTAKRLLTGQEYGRDETMAQVNSVVGRDPEAQRAWRAAVADVLADRVQHTAKDGEVSIAQVRKVWRDHQDTLAQVFSPEDMQTLERAHEMLAPIQNLSQNVVSGSATTDNNRLAGMVEAAILSATGNAITTGMIMKRIRVAANLIPGVREMSLNYKTQRLMERAMFDPDLARMLLERPITEGTGDLWNRDLRRLMVAGEASRQMYSEDDEFQEALE